MLFSPILFSSIVTIAHGFRVTSISSNLGLEPERPAYSGNNAEDVLLSCLLEVNEGEGWTQCSWSHVLPDTWGPNDREGYIICSAGEVTDDGSECIDRGNLAGNTYGSSALSWLNDYVRRIRFVVSETECGIRISHPTANDTGVWKCMVDDNSITGQSSRFWDETNLYVANRSQVIITDPDLQNNRAATISVDLSTNQGYLTSTCKAYYGYPIPTIRWYIDDISNEVTDLADISTSIHGEVVSSTIRLTIDNTKLGVLGITTQGKGSFSFSLGCYADQGNYFTQDDDFDDYYEEDDLSEVIVFGLNSGVGRLSSGAVFAVVVQLLFVFFVVL